MTPWERHIAIQGFNMEFYPDDPDDRGIDPSAEGLRNAGFNVQEV